jgi:hypothetical protein
MSIVQVFLFVAIRPSAAQVAPASPRASPAASAQPATKQLASTQPVRSAPPAPLAMWSPVDLSDIPFDYECGGLSFQAHAIADGLAIKDASPPILATARFGGPSTHDGTWRIVADDGERVTVAAVIDGRARTESRSIRSTSSVRPGVGTGRVKAPVRPGARVADGQGGYWRLDPRRPPPSTGSGALHLKVWYMGCQASIRLRGSRRWR